MKTYTFFVEETLLSTVEIKAETEAAARDQWRRFSFGDEDAPDLDVTPWGDGGEYKLLDLSSVTE